MMLEDWDSLAFPQAAAPSKAAVGAILSFPVAVITVAGLSLSVSVSCDPASLYVVTAGHAVLMAQSAPLPLSLGVGSVRSMQGRISLLQTVTYFAAS